MPVTDSVGGRTASWGQLLQRESEPCVTACMKSVFPMNGQEKQFLTGFYTEQKRAINIGEIVPKEQIKPVQSEESRMQTLFRAIRIGDSAEIERAAHGEMEKLHKNTETMSQYNLATMEIVSGFF